MVVTARAVAVIQSDILEGGVKAQPTTAWRPCGERARKGDDGVFASGGGTYSGGAAASSQRSASEIHSGGCSRGWHGMGWLSFCRRIAVENLMQLCGGGAP